jgi:dolichol kinase
MRPDGSSEDFGRGTSDRLEDRRQLVHFSMTGFALLLRWLDPWQAWTLAGAAIVFNWIVMPLLGWDRGLRRADSPFVDGAKLYPVAVLAVLLLFPTRPQVVAAAAWAVMGVGDAASNVIGRRFGRPGFLGRADRSWLGTFAFIACAWPAAWAIASFVARSSATVTWGPALAAAVAGAAAELVPLPRRFDDNVPIALAAAGAFALVS